MVPPAYTSLFRSRCKNKMKDTSKVSTQRERERSVTLVERSGSIFLKRHPKQSNAKRIVGSALSYNRFTRPRPGGDTYPSTAM